MKHAEILGLQSAEGADILQSTYRPVRVNKRTGQVEILHSRGFYVQSMLLKDEWAAIDTAVQQSARTILRAVDDLRVRGLTQTLGGLGTLVTQWYKSSEVTPATINMSGQGAEHDLPDVVQVGVPVPVIFKTFPLDIRTLMASRNMGDGLDVTAATEATMVVAEALETMLVSGASVQLNGQKLYGYTNHPDRNTDTATNYGGGDWTTIANVVPTVSGMISAAMGDRHWGPYVLYLPTTQYNECTLAYYTDGSGDTPADRILRMPQISSINLLPTLTAGNILLVQMDRTVVEWAQALDIQVREWMSGDGLQSNFKVLAVAAPKVKSDYSGRSGIVHATGA